MRSTIYLAALALLSAGLVSSPHAAAAPATCQGMGATITADGGEVTGTEGDDVISTTGVVEVDALGGNDVICAAAGQVHAGPGDDSVLSTASDNLSTLVVNLDAGDDTFAGGNSANHVDDPAYGGDSGGRDRVTTAGAGSRNVIFSGVPGEPNFDELELGAGADRLVLTLTPGSHVVADGGGGVVGVDTVVLTGPAADAALWTVDLRDGSVEREGTPVAEIVGFGSHDLTFGSRAEVGVQGSKGRDSVRLGRGRFDAALGRGDDVVILDGAGSRSRFDGGPGTDAIYSHARRRIAADLGAGTLVMDGSSSRVTSIETFLAQARTVRIGGDRRPNSIGVRGCDVRGDGAGGADRVFYGGIRSTGNEIGCDTRTIVLQGGAGSDRIFGSRKDDILVGGPGFDWAYGFHGRDRCDAEREKDCEI